MHSSNYNVFEREYNQHGDYDLDTFAFAFAIVVCAQRKNSRRKNRTSMHNLNGSFAIYELQYIII